MTTFFGKILLKEINYAPCQRKGNKLYQSNFGDLMSTNPHS
jgi:hypothetical protein